ncbi:hypothetical protein MMC25_003756 [Agyrium rufum]|nr:hypothetical protein [Agyrium rufum]
MASATNSAVDHAGATTTTTTASIEHASAAPASAHKRTYQACIPCRKRKVRCDLGSVDTPSDPPCVRCRREKKNCFFSETRRKRKAEDGGEEDFDEDYPRGAGRRAFGSGSYGRDSETPPLKHRGGFADISGPPLIHSRDTQSPGYPKDPQSHTPAGGRTHKVEPQDLRNDAAAALLQSPINNPGDALHLLFEAAGRSGDLDRPRVHAGAVLSPKDKSAKLRSKTQETTEPMVAIDPAITSDSAEQRAKEAILQTALQTWSRLRFVRAGWLTSTEAMAYIQYYYQYLAPLTPVFVPDFSSPSTHAKLLNEEPMLTVTILTIASRFLKISGSAGESRSFLTHERLWKYLQGMISRMFWAQEQFAGGFNGASAGVNGTNGIGGGLRALGTVESLLLLSDWHPRSMHFPPDDDGALLIPLASEIDIGSLASQPHQSIFGGWIEPAIRSDRMCWSLIGSAYTLAYELGVFDCLATDQTWSPRPGLMNERSNRIARLLYVYTSLTAGRLGHPNMLSHQLKLSRIPYFEMIAQPIKAPESPSNAQHSTEEMEDSVQRAWAEITSLMRATNEEMFATKAYTQDLTRSKRYFEMLEKYTPKLQQFKTRLDSLRGKLSSSQCTYVNSLALQAVLEECAAHAAAPSGKDESSNDTPDTPPALLSSKLVRIYKENEPYINEVIDASRELLLLAINGLGQDKWLRHAPVRTYFRILSCAMFLLKSFALGAKSNEVEISLDLLKRTVKALRTNVVDDVHLSHRIADLLDSITKSLKTKFVALAVSGDHNIRHSNVKHQSRHNASNKIESSIRRPSIKDLRAVNRSRDRSSMGSAEDLHGGPLAGLNLNPIDPNDASITMMPPPDFVFSNALDLSQKPSPDQQHAYSYPAPNATAGTYSPQYQSSSDTYQQSLLNPQSNSPPTNRQKQQQTFRPQHRRNLSSQTHPEYLQDEGSYQWVALNINNIQNLSNTNLAATQYGHSGTTLYGNPNTMNPQQQMQMQSSTSNSMSRPQQQMISGGGGGPTAQAPADGMGSAGNVFSGIVGWPMGAFGPEISDNLEMLGMLGADGYSSMGYMGDGTGQAGVGTGTGSW